MEKGVLKLDIMLSFVSQTLRTMDALLLLKRHFCLEIVLAPRIVDRLASYTRPYYGLLNRIVKNYPSWFDSFNISN